MEASLRSSAPRPVNCRFVKTEPALHEATQRFVESHMRDVRISQFADLKYASTLVKQGTWYWLRGGKHGFLVMAPNSPIVWMDEKGTVSFKISIRVSKELLQGTICLASLQMSDGLLVLEDMRYIAGKNIEADPFSKRWETLLDFYRNSYVCDTMLQGGLTVEPAVYYPLESAASWDQNTPMYMVAQGETQRKRIRIQIRDKEVKTYVPERKYPPTREPSQLVKEKDKQKQRLHEQKRDGQVQEKEKKSQIHVSSPQVKDTYVIPSKEFPDTYLLMINGEQKGYAAVQGLALSRALRDRGTEAKIPVNVEWNPEFSSHEIVSIA